MGAVVLEYDAVSGRALCQQCNRFFNGDMVEILTPDKPAFSMEIKNMTDLDGNPVKSCNHAQMKFYISTDNELKPMDILVVRC